MKTQTTADQIEQFGKFMAQGATSTLKRSGKDEVQAVFSNGRKVKRLKALAAQAFRSVMEQFKPKHSTANVNQAWNHDATSLPAPRDFMAALHKVLGLKGIACLMGDPDQEDDRADGLMPMISLNDIGREWGIKDPWGAGFCALCERLIGIITLAYNKKVANYLESALKEQRVRVEQQTKEAWLELETGTTNVLGEVRYFLMPVATGLTFDGLVYAPEDARNAVLEGGGLPLTLAHVISVLLAWPERLNRYNVRWIDCVGCEFRRGDGSEFLRCPCVFFDGEQLKFDAHGASFADSLYGATAAFPGVPGN